MHQTDHGITEIGETALKIHFIAIWLNVYHMLNPYVNGATHWTRFVFVIRHGIKPRLNT